MDVGAFVAVANHLNRISQRPPRGGLSVSAGELVNVPHRGLQGFIIRALKTDNRFWRADISKADGSKIKAAGQTELFTSIPVLHDSITPEKALEEARRLIDAGGIS